MKLPRKHSTRRAGMALTVVIFMLGLFAIVAGVLATAVTADARRTRMLAQDAQLRQLLLVGERVASDALDRPPPDPVRVPLPAPLAEAGASVTVSFPDASDAGTRVARVEASLPRRHTSQALRYARTGGRWGLVSAATGD